MNKRNENSSDDKSAPRPNEAMLAVLRETEEAYKTMSGGGSTAHSLNLLPEARGEVMPRINLIMLAGLLILGVLVGFLLYLGRYGEAVGGIGIIGMLLTNWLNRAQAPIAQPPAESSQQQPRPKQNDGN